MSVYSVDGIQLWLELRTGFSASTERKTSIDSGDVHDSEVAEDEKIVEQ